MDNTVGKAVITPTKYVRTLKETILQLIKHVENVRKNLK